MSAVRAEKEEENKHAVGQVMLVSGTFQWSHLGLAAEVVLRVITSVLGCGQCLDEVILVTGARRISQEQTVI
jgi:hypothetical protein